MFLKPEPEACSEEPCEEASDSTASQETAGGEDAEPNYVRMKSQFVVPVVKDDKVQSMVVLDLSLEVAPGTEEAVYAREPKVRDAFLRVLFDHAHIGGFDGTFTESGRLSVLRVALLESARSVVGPNVSDILITDIARQEF